MKQWKTKRHQEQLRYWTKTLTRVRTSVFVFVFCCSIFLMNEFIASCSGSSHVKESSGPPNNKKIRISIIPNTRADALGLTSQGLSIRQLRSFILKKGGSARNTRSPNWSSWYRPILCLLKAGLQPVELTHHLVQSSEGRVQKVQRLSHDIR
jgi:hypothetical protein